MEPSTSSEFPFWLYSSGFRSLLGDVHVYGQKADNVSPLFFIQIKESEHSSIKTNSVAFSPHENYTN
jgi:hypothetical protein